MKETTGTRGIQVRITVKPLTNHMIIFTLLTLSILIYKVQIIVFILCDHNKI